MQFYAAAFHDLDSERVVGIDLGPIPRSAIMNYARELGMDTEGFDDLYYHVRAMDVFFLKWRAKQKPKT